MAPVPKKKLAPDSDDFITTILDSDTEVPDFDTEIDDNAAPPRLNKKRKRDNPTVIADAGPGGKNKKRKKESQNRVAPFPNHEDEDSEEEDNWALGGEDDGAMASDFEFQVGDQDTSVLDDFDGWGFDSMKQPQSGGIDKKGVDVDEIIARRRERKEAKQRKRRARETQWEGVEEGEEETDAEENFAGFEDEEVLADDAFGMGADGEDEEGFESEAGSASDASELQDMEPDKEMAASPVSHPMDIVSESSGDEDDLENSVEAERRAAFFAPEENIEGLKPASVKSLGSFQNMRLSRPILKGLASVGFTEPTPIQAKTIPVALLGKDVVGGAVTGSGKTAAFMIPILERLLYRLKKVPTTRVAILMPTRELAVQCFNVAKKLASFTDITFAQIVGGFSLREQENVLKQRPDVVIATPGRFIDHMRNSACFAVDTIEILVLDEADRMLEDGFADELNEILTTIPKSRQTMLFSATMTDSVDKLIRVGLNRPVRLLVNAKKQTVSGLVQEFVRLRLGREEKRLAYLMYLCENVYTDRVIIFFRQKREAHRVRVIFGLCGLKAAELHGSMSQEQRISAVESFRNGQVSYLLATDLASRGLDIKGVDAVLNYSAPQTHEIYLHRVGRTARAGRSGRACTIAAEPDRKVVKAAVKAAKGQGAKVVSRAVPPEAADGWYKRLQDLDEEIEEVLKEEKEERVLQAAERDVKKGENLMIHDKEIMSRPKRTWFETEKEKKAAKERGYLELNKGEVEVKGKRRKLSNKDKKKLDRKDAAKDGKMYKKGKVERGKGAPAKSKGDKKSRAKTKSNRKAKVMKGAKR